LRNQEKIKNAAFFSTCAGRPGKCLEQMEELWGKKPVLKKALVRERLDEGAKELVNELKTLMDSIH
ncbi:MAG TPA: flavodoxin, partial [Thermococcus litoralis]|nr:flavodoxin [Thermococcus litoralis]